MEVFIHGKPIAGSSKATPNIEATLYQKLVDDFFSSMSQLKFSDALIVDVRYWKNTWYSIYTYWLGNNVKDTAGRDSFFAISIVVPKQYYCLVSEVHKHLKSVCETFVVGHYLSGNGDFMVQTFEDEKLFNGLVSKVNTQFVNLQEPFDPSFKPQASIKNDVIYNIEDCDSKAFVQTLKTANRIIVTQTATTKDAIIASLDSNVIQVKTQREQSIQKNKAQQTIIEQKGHKITTLEAEIAELKKQSSTSANSMQQRIKQLESQVQALQNKADNLTNERITLNKKCQSLTKKLLDISSIAELKEMDNSNSPTPVAPPPESKWKQVFFVLIIVIGCIIFFLPVKNIEKNKQLIASLQEKVEKKEKENIRLQASISNLENQILNLQNQQSQNTRQSQATNNNKDIDCKIAVIQNDIVTASDKVDLSLPICIKIGVKKDGYDFKLDNIKNQDEVRRALKAGEPFTIVKSDTTKKVIISYRRSNKQNANPLNIITLK